MLQKANFVIILQIKHQEMLVILSFFFYIRNFTYKTLFKINKCQQIAICSKRRNEKLLSIAVKRENKRLKKEK